MPAPQITFLHGDGRPEAVETALDLTRVGGVSPYARDLIWTCHQALSLRPDLAVTWMGYLAQARAIEAPMLVVFGDEKGHWPTFLGGAGPTVLKQGPKSVWDSQSPPGPLGWALSRLRSLRNLTQAPRGGTPVPVAQKWTIPLGPNFHFPLDIDGSRPFERRHIDVLFGGTIGYRPLGPVRLTPTPKAHSRHLCAQALRRIRDQRSDLTVKVLSSELTWSDPMVTPTAYLEVMQRTKIALAPRGNMVETYRHYEAASCGCVILSDPVEDTWFNRTAPFVIVKDWSKVDQVIARLLADPDRLAELGAKTLTWWHTTAQPQAAGHTLARLIEGQGDL